MPASPELLRVLVRQPLRPVLPAYPQTPLHGRLHHFPGPVEPHVRGGLRPEAARRGSTPPRLLAHVQHRRPQAHLHTGDHPSPRVLKAFKPQCDQALGLGDGPGSQRGGGDDAQSPLGPAEQPVQFWPRARARHRRRPHHVPSRQDHLHPQHLVRHAPVAAHPVARPVGGDRSPYGGDVDAPRIVGQEQPVRPERLVELDQHHPGLRLHQPVLPRDAAHPVQPTEVDRDPALDWRRAAHDPAPAPERHHRDSFRVRPPQQLAHVLNGRGPHHRRRQHVRGDACTVGAGRDEGVRGVPRQLPRVGHHKAGEAPRQLASEKAT
ncbi:hypothetical protein HRbin32_01628 [bacterium HR32]|nr:hypothetical protein HRbin32_01628 [bacterium HR32]